MLGGLTAFEARSQAPARPGLPQSPSLRPCRRLALRAVARCLTKMTVRVNAAAGTLFKAGTNVADASRASRVWRRKRGLTQVP